MIGREPSGGEIDPSSDGEKRIWARGAGGVGACRRGTRRRRGRAAVARSSSGGRARRHSAGRLIASAQIQDPRFYHTVILLVRHTRDGAFGIIVNHPLAEETIAKLLAAGGEDAAGVEGSIRVFAGGPVQPELGFLVHSADYLRQETMTVDGKVAITASKDALRDIGEHKGPQKFLFALGYAGWGPGQLDGEMMRNDWFTMPEDPALVFDADSGTLWDRALARHGQEL
jgi:putative transcriptional regulator